MMYPLIIGVVLMAGSVSARIIPMTDTNLRPRAFMDLVIGSDLIKVPAICLELPPEDFDQQRGECQSIISVQLHANDEKKKRDRRHKLASIKKAKLKAKLDKPEYLLLRGL